MRRRTTGEGIGRDELVLGLPEEEGYEIVWNRQGFAGDDSNKTACAEPGTANARAFRGDFFIKNKNHPEYIVYGEQDEDQHKSYDKSCDAVRTCAILGWKTTEAPIFMFRINPDS